MRLCWKLALAPTLTLGGRHPVRDLSNFNSRVTSYDRGFSNTISATGINLRNYGRRDRLCSMRHIQSFAITFTCRIPRRGGGGLLA